MTVARDLEDQVKGDNRLTQLLREVLADPSTPKLRSLVESNPVGEDIVELVELPIDELHRRTGLCERTAPSNLLTLLVAVRLATVNQLKLLGIACARRSLPALTAHLPSETVLQHLATSVRDHPGEFENDLLQLNLELTQLYKNLLYDTDELASSVVRSQGTLPMNESLEIRRYSKMASVLYVVSEMLKVQSLNTMVHLTELLLFAFFLATPGDVEGESIWLVDCFMGLVEQ